MKRMCVALALVLIAIGAPRAEEPTPEERQRLQKEVAQLDQERKDLAAQFRLPEATDKARRVVELCRRLYPKDGYPDGHPDLANGLTNLGTLLRDRGDSAAAEPVLREALEAYRTLYPKDKYPDGHPDLARGLDNLGGVLRSRGELEKAEPLLRQALDMRRGVYPKDRYPDGHTELARSLDNLGTLLKARGLYDQAEPLLREALDMRRAVYPKDKYPNGHSAIGLSLNNVGGVLQSQGKFSQAEPFYRELLEMVRALYPKEKYPDGHPNVASGLNNLGGVLENLGECVEAERLIREAVAMNRALFPREKYPDGHPDLLGAISRLAGVLARQGEMSQAEPLAGEALAMARALYPKEKYPDGHPTLAGQLDQMGAILQGMGESVRADPFFTESLEMYVALYPTKQFPNGHPTLARSLINQGRWLESQGHYAEANRYFREAVTMLRATFPKDKYPDGHPGLANALSRLGDSFFNLDKAEEAEKAYREALKMHQALYPRERFPRGHHDLAGSLSNVGVALQARGESAKAEPFQARAVEMFRELYPREHYPAGHPTLAFALHNLGALWLDQRQYARAEPFFREELEIQRQRTERLAQTAPEPVALNYAATFPFSRDFYLSATRGLDGSDGRAYEAVWHSKAALTRVYQRRHLALVAAAADDKVREDYERLQLLRRQREQLILAAADDLEARDAKVRRLDDQLDEAERRLLPKLPALGRAQRLARLGPADLQKLLPEDAVVIDLLRYTLHGPDAKAPGAPGAPYAPHYVAFVLSRDRVRRVELGAAGDIEEAVEAWRRQITLKVPADNAAARREHQQKMNDLAARLRKLTWEPLAGSLPGGTRTVYIAPDAALTQLPWAALPGTARDTVLLDDYALAVLPHAPYLLEALTPADAPAARKPAEGLLLVGGVRFNGDPEPVQKPAPRGEPVVGQRITWPDLPGTAEELRRVEELAKKAGQSATVLTGTAASTDRLREALARVRVAHVATHGFFADEKVRSLLRLDEDLFDRTKAVSGEVLERIGPAARSPLVLSGLVCAGANLPEAADRGVLSGDAIAGLLLDDLQLAVLSACDTGLGEVAGGEGVYGLQRAFHVADCKNVVASLWKVDDAATAALMTRLYGYLLAEEEEKRLPPAEALRRAQLDLYRHPELIPAWSRGEQRAPGRPRPATTPPPPDTPPELVTSEGRAPVRLWAAFTLSGIGR